MNRSRSCLSRGSKGSRGSRGSRGSEGSRISRGSRSSSRGSRKPSAPLSGSDMDPDSNAVWEEECVDRRLELGASGDITPSSTAAGAVAAEGEDGDDGKDHEDAAEEAEPPQQQDATDVGSDERFSDITDPFEEFHYHGALQTEDSIPAPSLQPPGSRRTQFLRAVSLFSPTHQLAVLEVRELQGVSLLERSTSLTAESLEPGVSLLERRASARASVSLEQVAAPQDSGVRGTSTRSKSKTKGDSKRGSDRSSRPHSTSPAPSHASATTTAMGEGSTMEEYVTPKPTSEELKMMDPSLADLLRDLWAERSAEDAEASGAAAGAADRRKSQVRRAAAADRELANYPDVLSGLWRMLDCYDEFVCSPPGYHAFRQDKPHWLDQEPIPWAVREAAREKCTRWLQTCPVPA